MISDKLASRKTYLFVESPTKQKVFLQVASVLFKQNNFFVISTKGHIRSVKKGIVPYDPDFAIHWINTPHINRVVKTIKDRGNDLINIILATDPDREGELISNHIVEILNDNNVNFDYFRVVCNELNYENIYNNIVNSINNNQKCNSSLINACITRIKFDMTIGLNGSSLLWRKLYGCTSMGRVQSVCLLKIKEKEDAIRQFVRKTKYKAHALLKINNDEYKISCVLSSDAEKIFESKDECEKYVKELNNKKYIFSGLSSKNVSVKNNLKPLSTIDLYNVMSKNMFSISETSKIAQSLYEGIKIYEKIEGIITYMRTDSNYIAESFRSKIYNFICQKYGNNYLCKKDMSRNKGKNKQESHEAIRLTMLDIDINSLDVSARYKKVLHYIKYYTIAPFMIDGKDCVDTISFRSDDNLISFTSDVRSIIYPGYRILDPCYNKSNRPAWSHGDDVKFSIDFITYQYSNNAPTRYTEISLIKEMESMGIGRPSTYKNIINIIKNRDYAYILDRRYSLAPKGYILCYFLDLYMKNIINYNFTSYMEKLLDEISDNSTDPFVTMNQFICIFKDVVEKIDIIDRKEIINNISKHLRNQYGSLCCICNTVVNMYFYKNKPFLSCENRHMCDINEYGFLEPDMIIKNKYPNKETLSKKKTYKKNKKSE